MRYFSWLDAEATNSLFHIPPAEFTRDSTSDLLAFGLGATLYLPATRPHLAADIVRCHTSGVISMICCLEDSIRDEDVPSAERHLIAELRHLAAADAGGVGNGGPLLFVRVRTAAQIRRIAEGLGPFLGILSGFVLPKFAARGEPLLGLEAVREISASQAIPLMVMPILESPAVAHAETRISELLEIRDLLNLNRDLVLAVRVGVTDLSGVFGLRRPATLTAWDLGPVATALADIVNVFTRHDGTGFIVTGPVWEYFNRRDQPDDRQLVDGLIREIRRDLANGILGKTVIHPSHADVVNAMLVVGHEEYCDATTICGETDGTGGVLRSAYHNKMNEVRPHLAWAGRILRRAATFGVAAPGISPLDLLESAAETRKIAA